ncbi:protein O-mannosyl-transferase TMTC1-like isoform X2 [Artemia franciscana]|uniref:protein O-mannosyl-transferase TMTC1-like isoform X2 n=1 Tax=Artemia franciscana TaxID=6661 RepID=UPI0032DBEC69
MNVSLFHRIMCNRKRPSAIQRRRNNMQIPFIYGCQQRMGLQTLYQQTFNSNLQNGFNKNRLKNSERVLLSVFKCKEGTNKATAYACSLFCAVVAAIVYSNSIDGDLVHDDLSAISDNPDVTDDAWIFELFRNDFWGMKLTNPESHKSYRPLTTLSFRMNYLVHGVAPRGYHIVNILLHATTTALLVDTAVRCLKSSCIGAFVAGLLFALHPIHTEAVSGIVGRADILASVFFLLSFRIYWRYAENDNKITKNHHRLLSVFYAGVAMLFKEHGLSVVGVSCLLELILKTRSNTRLYFSENTKTVKIRRSLWKSVTCAMAYLSMILPFLVFRIWIMGSELPSFSDQENPAAASPFFLTRFFTWSYLPILNAFLLICPIWLSYDWQLGTVPLVESFLDMRCGISITIYGIVGALAWKLIRKGEPLEIWCLLTMVVPFLPATNLIAPVGFVLAERLLYLPSLGFCLLIGQGFYKIWLQCSWRSIRAILSLSLCLTLVSFAGKTWLRNYDWLSRDSLFRSGLKTFPQNAKMHYNYANLQKDYGHVQIAVFHYKEAIRLWPSYASAHNNLGTLLIDFKAAKYHFESALRKHPKHTNALYNLASLERKSGNTPAAVRLLESCLNIEPFHKESLIMMANILFDKGDFRQVHIVSLFIKEAQRRKGRRHSEITELWNNLSRTVDLPGKNHGSVPNIFQYLNAVYVEGKRIIDQPASGLYQNR